MAGEHLKILVCGTGPFAVPSFRALLQSSHRIAALVTRPIADPGNRRKSAANPMRELAEAAGLEVFDPPDLNHPAAIARLVEWQADLMMVCDYGQILSPECLQSARLGGINLHGSLLPRYRGAAPVAWAIWRGETTTGVSVIHMTGQLDGGPILASATLPIGADETCAELEPRLAELGVLPVFAAIEQLAAWDQRSPLGVPQDPALATRARRLRKEDARIDWSRSARKIHRQLRALQPWPGTYTTWQRPGSAEPVRLIVLRGAPAEVHPETTTASPLPVVAGLPSGTVLVADGRNLIVQCGTGQFSLREVQPAGKRPMPITDFLRGYPLRPGDRLQ